MLLLHTPNLFLVHLFAYFRQLFHHYAPAASAFIKCLTTVRPVESERPINIVFVCPSVRSSVDQVNIFKVESQDL